MDPVVSDNEILDDPQRTVGEVRFISSHRACDAKGRAYEYRQVDISDESDRFAELRDEFRRIGDDFEHMLRRDPGIPSTNVSGGVVDIPEENDAARWLYYGESGEATQMLEWATRFPTAIALRTYG